MTIHCTHCGAALRKDNARFCNNCGILDPLNEQSLDTSVSIPIPPRIQGIQEKNKKPVLREQITQQPPQLPIRRTLLNELPTLDRQNDSHMRVGSSNEVAEPKRGLPTRELRVKVWKQLEDMPARREVTDTLEELATQQVLASAASEHESISEQAVSEHESVSEVPSPPQPPVQPIQHRRLLTRIGEAPPFKDKKVHGKTRMRTTIAILLCLLIIGTLGVWALLFQAFNVSPVTQPWQSFKDSNLAVSYPNAWTTQTDEHTSSVYFADTSRTAQVIITVTALPSSDVTHYLQQEATQLGMTNVLSGAQLSFAGASWHQIQGNVQQSGATYNEVILATVHGNRLFVLAQLAPQGVYADEEKLVFSAMRSSFQFV